MIQRRVRENSVEYNSAKALDLCTVFLMRKTADGWKLSAPAVFV